MTAKDQHQATTKQSIWDRDLCPPPLEAQKGLTILIKHLLGDDWYTTLSMNTKQTNAEAVDTITRLYPKKENLWEKLKGILSK